MADKSANTASQRAAAVEAGERDERSETTSAGFSKDKGPVTQQTQVTTAEGLATVEGRKAQIERTDKRLEELNERNRAGHEKNMEREATTGASCWLRPQPLAVTTRISSRIRAPSTTVTRSCTCTFIRKFAR
jgi:hypothetical protein